MGRVKRPVAAEIGRKLIAMDMVDSTNTVARELGEKDAPHGTVVVAGRQTKGRGRLGRAWVSPEGNIYMSIILRPALTPANAALLTMTAAVSCAQALREMSGLKVEIKWPNDLMMSGKKLGGILTEMKSRGRRILFAVVGIGINLNSGAEDISPELKTTATSLLVETGKKFSKTGLIARILDKMEFWYTALVEGNTRSVLDAWRSLSSTLGRQVRIIAGNDVFEGLAEALDGEGRLIVRLPSGTQKVISAGDVTMVR